MTGTHPTGAGPGPTVLRDGVVRIEVDGELLLLDRATGTVARLDAAATEALGRGTARGAEVLGALDALGLTAASEASVARRRVLEGTLLAGLGISLMALPTAASAVSAGDPSAQEPFAVATGAVASFDPNVNSTVNAIVVQDDGAIVLGGLFSSVGGVTRSRIARVRPNGQLDTDFNPSASSAVKALALDSNGRILLGGEFTSVGGVARSRFARLWPNGTPDELSVNFSSNVNALVLQQVGAGGAAEEMIVAGGSFANVGSTVVKRLIRVRTDGTLDPNWVTLGPSFDVNALVVDSNNGVIVGGSFQTFFTEANTLRSNCAGIVRIGSDDRFDTSFTTLVTNGVPARSAVAALAIDADDRILLGGGFETTFANGGPARSFIARMHANGAVDTDFAPVLNGSVAAIAVQADGRAVIGGTFTTIDGQTRNRIARLHADTAGTGFLDTTFDPNAGGSVNALAIQANGRVVLGGAFATLGGSSRNRLARLD